MYFNVVYVICSHERHEKPIEQSLRSKPTVTFLGIPFCTETLYAPQNSDFEALREVENVLPLSFHLAYSTVAQMTVCLGYPTDALVFGLSRTHLLPFPLSKHSLVHCVCYRT
jgi:hypothetical protein